MPGDERVRLINHLNEPGPVAVGEIRKALGDNKDNPRFIQTIPREGYRFIAPVCSIHRMETRGQVEQNALDLEEKHSTETPPAKNLAAERQVEIPPAAVNSRAKGRIWAYLGVFSLLACGLAYMVWERLLPSSIMSQHSGIADLWRISSSGGELELLFGTTGENGDPDISADGRKLAFSNTRNQYVLTILGPAGGRTLELMERRLAIVHPMFSPRGDKIAFFATEGEGGSNQISTIDTDGANLNQVTRDNKERNFFPHWSGDGASLYYYRSLPDLSFRRIAITGGESEEVVRGWSWETQYGARVDASGEWIVYTGTKAGAPSRTLIRNITTGNERALARALDDPRWSADAKYVLGTDLGTTSPQGDISIGPVDGTGCRKLARGYLAVWSFDNRSVYFLRTAGHPDRAQLGSISVTGDNERTITELGPMRPIGHYYDISPRGEIVYVQFKPGKRDLWLAEMK